MKMQSRKTIEIATLLGQRGFTCCAVEVHTPDGRTWNIAPELGGWRLFEIHVGTDRQPTEHDNPDGIWPKADLLDYLEAVTGAKTLKERLA